MIATLIMHGKTGYPVLWALSMKKYQDQFGPPWIDSQVGYLHKVKHTVWSRAKPTNKSGDWSTFKKYRNKL